MPRTPIDYSKSVIYTIIHVNDTSLNYVGSTTDFSKRKYGHKSNCKSSQIKLYVMIRDNGNWDMFKMMPYKLFPCNSSTELKIEEERCRLELNTTLNTNRCHITEEHKKEYYELHKEHKKEKSKEYYEKNKIELREQRKDYYELKKEEIIEKVKDYYEKNKVEISEKAKDYYEKNKVEIREQNKEKYTCECGSVLSKCAKSRHNNTKKHLNFINVPK